MKRLFRFMDWPWRAKMAALFVIVSLLPLALATFLDIRQARVRLIERTAALLAARGDQLVDQIDTFHRAYQRSVNKFARLPLILQFCRADADEAERLQPSLGGVFDAQLSTDPDVRGVAILDLSGKVRVTTENHLIGINLSHYRHVREALQGSNVISDIHLAESQTGDAPTIAYLAPVLGTNGAPVAIAIHWIRADALWKLMKRANELAGPNSFAVLFDRRGIRIGHTYSDEIVFHPGGQLDSAVVDALIAERRFGEKTRQLLEDVRAFPEQFDRAVAESPDPRVFRGFAPINQKWNYGVGRRMETVPWTLFYMIPEQTLNAEIGAMIGQTIFFAGVIMLIVLVAGKKFAAVILKPVRSLSQATEAIAGGDLAARVPPGHADELGRLGTSFNAMAERIGIQATALQKARDELEIRVQERTAELGQTTKDLQVEVTERKEAEARLERQRAELQLIFDTVPALIFYKDVQHRLLRVNQELVRLVGVPKEVLEGKTDRELNSPNAELYYRDEDEIFASGEAKRGIVEPMESPRGLRWLLTDKLPYRDETGKIAGIIGFALDITERRQAEQKLHEQLERLNLLHQITRAIGERQDLQSIFQVVIRTLEEQQPVDFCCVCLYDQADNALTVTRVGVRSQELAMELAMTEQSRIDIDENGLSRCVRGQLVYEPDLSEVSFPFPQRLAKGGLRSLVISPLLVESQVFGILVAARRQPQGFSSGECEFLGQLSGHVALASHQANLYGALQRAYDDLRQSQQAVMQQERLRSLGQMASGVAHDINNAISPVALYTESLLENEPNLSARTREYLKTIHLAVHDVAETIARMREFYRQREPQLTLAPVNLNQLVQQVVDLTRARWSDMTQKLGIVIRMQTELAADLPAIMGVESEIRESLTNLVFNAVDAMPKGGTLTLRTRVAESSPGSANTPPLRHVQAEVMDTGVGMDEETRRRCLEPFFTTKGERGTGLGLATVYGMVQRHSADIEIESEPGSGTTVRLSFSVPAATAAEPVQFSGVHAVPPRLRILVVDDDPVLLKSLRDILETDGHVVTITNGGQEGIDAFRAGRDSEPFAVVVTDLGMPSVDGRKVAREVKALSPSTPVILLTGWGQRLVAEGDVPPHVDLVLSKPPKLRDLREALAQCCSLGKP